MIRLLLLSLVLISLLKDNSNFLLNHFGQVIAQQLLTISEGFFVFVRHLR